MRIAIGLAIGLAIAALGFVGSADATASAPAPAAHPDAHPHAHPDDIKGQYDLADGRTLTVIARGRRVVAEFDGHPQTALLPAGGAVFVAADGSFSLRFTQFDNGNVTGVTLEEKPGALPGQ